MNDIPTKIEGVHYLAGDGTGTAMRKENRNNMRRHDEHDTVSIAEEARIKSALGKDDETANKK